MTTVKIIKWTRVRIKAKIKAKIKVNIKSKIKFNINNRKSEKTLQLSLENHNKTK
jgi:hypothetical protein